MALEVACPACGTQLRAPDDAAGKRVKCKKCGHRFVIPGEIIAEPIGESQMLSAIDEAPPASLPAVPNPAAAPPGDPFSFDEPGGPMISVGGRGKKPSARKSERFAPKANAADATKVDRPVKKSGGAKKVLLIVGGILGFLFLICAGSVAAVYFLVIAPAIEKATPPMMKLPPPAAVPSEAVPPVEDVIPKKTPPAIKGKGGAEAKKPAPPSVPTGALVAPKKVSFTVDVPTESIRNVRFTGGKSPSVAVYWKSDAGFQGSGGKESIDVYSVANGFRSARVEFPARLSNIDAMSHTTSGLSPDGRYFALLHHFSINGSMLSVIDLVEKKLTINGDDPFSGDDWQSLGAKYIVFPDDERVIAMSKSGCGATFKLADGSRIKSVLKNRTSADNSFDQVSMMAPESGRPTQLGLSKTGNELLTISAKPGSIGEILETTKLPGQDRGYSNSNAIRADARRTFLFGFTQSNSPGVHFYDLKLKSLTHVPLPKTVNLKRFSAAEFLAGDRMAAVVCDEFTTGIVFDLEVRKYAFSFAALTAPNRIHPDPENGLFWYVQADPADPRKSLVVAVRADFDDYQAILGESAAGAIVELKFTPEGLKR